MKLQIKVEAKTYEAEVEILDDEEGAQDVSLLRSLI